MGYYCITKITAKLNSLINGGREKDDDSYRHLHLVKTDNRCLTFIYSLARWKTYSEDEKRRSITFRTIKLILGVATGGGLITPVIEKTSNTICQLVICIQDVKDGMFILKYDIAVCNGSFFHKKMVSSFEKTDILWNLQKNGIRIDEPYVTIDFKRTTHHVELDNLSKARDAFFKGDSLVYFT